ncbi:MAG: bifunctional hydroxymethylpyrimidine kinase/phosphomethylpyrimidine kinase [Thermodesulfovibrionales bacterium]
MPISLTIAGSDPTGGAGLQADLRVFWYFGVYGLSAITSITCQNTTGVEDIYPIRAEELERQLTVLFEDIRPHSLKTGMIYSKENVEVIEKIIKRYELTNLVIDPVTVSSTGVSLLEDRTLDILRERLIPLSRVITPNIYEASLLTGLKIENIEDMKKAAQMLKRMGAETVVITGGHLAGNVSVDVFYDRDFSLLESERIGGEFHGTGCIFSAAIAANLAIGKSPLESVKIAKDFLKIALEKAFYPGKGMAILMNPVSERLLM